MRQTYLLQTFRQTNKVCYREAQLGCINYFARMLVTVSFFASNSEMQVCIILCLKYLLCIHCFFAVSPLCFLLTGYVSDGPKSALLMGLLSNKLLYLFHVSFMSGQFFIYFSQGLKYIYYIILGQCTCDLENTRQLEYPEMMQRSIIQDVGWYRVSTRLHHLFDGSKFTPIRKADLQSWVETDRNRLSRKAQFRSDS